MIENFAQWLGIISIAALFCIKFYIALTIKGNTRLTTDQKIEHLVAVILWASIYFLMLVILRIFTIIGFGTIEGLRIVSGFTSVIPLAGVLFNFWMANKLE